MKDILIGLSTFLGGIIGILGTIFVVYLYNILAWGFILYKFWKWFLIPVFTELPTITIYQAVGINLCTLFFHSHEINTSVEDEKKKKSSAFASFLTPWVALLFGYLTYLIIKS